ncbi:c-type cytochrome [Thiohalomonas denitrificans]|uniref:Cytochrome C oxidase, cbb3-type, subunit III n=1 Tax=Thiohalomonas denitrificans TaxID=415747 RepID=A0A1G5QVS8_9GAMM|nr:cytochrome c [Thiohalomonas denitrificans]SCZ65650.1 Cytochrome C oxidase, cbb3-type, subunit III [Thiohalomonas denitrificans]
MDYVARLVGLVLLLWMTVVPAANDSGEALYLQHCAVCHQPDGKGIPGIVPPVAGHQRVTSDDPEEIQVYLSRVIFGYHGGLIVDHQVYSGRMPPIGYIGRVNDSELLDLINYTRTAWDNDARPVTFKELATARQKGEAER